MYVFLHIKKRTYAHQLRWWWLSSCAGLPTTPSASTTSTDAAVSTTTWWTSGSTTWPAASTTSPPPPTLSSTTSCPSSTETASGTRSAARSGESTHPSAASASSRWAILRDFSKYDTLTIQVSNISFFTFCKRRTVVSNYAMGWCKANQNSYPQETKRDIVFDAILHPICQ